MWNVKTAWGGGTQGARAVQDSVVPVHSEPYKPGPQFCTRYIPGREASVMISVRCRCGLSDEAGRSVVLTHSGRTVPCASGRLEVLPERRCQIQACWAPDWLTTSVCRVDVFVWSIAKRVRRRWIHGPTMTTSRTASVRPKVSLSASVLLSLLLVLPLTWLL